MASIEPHKRNNVASWRVKWREDGRHSHAITVTFSDETQARKFKSLVDEAGNRMPAAKLLEAYGLEWVLGDQPAEPAPPVVVRVTVSQLCWLYLKALAATPRPPSVRTLKDYQQYVRDHVDTHWFGTLDADDADRDQARDWQAEIAAKPGFSAQSANKVRTGVVAPAFRWARISVKKDKPPILLADHLQLVPGCRGYQRRGHPDDDRPLHRLEGRDDGRRCRRHPAVGRASEPASSTATPPALTITKTRI